MSLVEYTAPSPVRPLVRITRSLFTFVLWVIVPTSIMAAATVALAMLVAPDYADTLLAGRTYDNTWHAWLAITLVLLVDVGLTVLLALTIRRFAWASPTHLAGLAATMCMGAWTAMAFISLLPSPGLSASVYPRLLNSSKTFTLPMVTHADAQLVARFMHALPVGSCRFSSDVLYLRGEHGIDRLPMRMEICRQAHSVSVQRAK